MDMILLNKLMDKKGMIVALLAMLISCLSLNAFATDASIVNLKVAYPEHVSAVSSSVISWKDGTRMQIGSSFALFNWFQGKSLGVNSPEVISDKDVIHARFEPFFKKMYGGTPRQVGKNLVTIYWMPHVFGNRYPLKVTTVNDVDKKLKRVSANLEKLPPQYYKYLENPGGSYYWRQVKGESALSAHSFGIAIDINLRYSNYWLWDYQKTNRPISDLRTHKLSYQTVFPWK